MIKPVFCQPGRNFCPESRPRRRQIAPRFEDRRRDQKLHRFEDYRPASGSRWLEAFSEKGFGQRNVKF